MFLTIASYSRVNGCMVQYGMTNESSSLFCNKSSRYGAVSPPDTVWITSVEKCKHHAIRPNDTLQGISVKYSVPIELIKRVNKLYNQDFLFLRETLLIPVKNKSLTNGAHTPEPAIVDSEDIVPQVETNPEEKEFDSLFSKFDAVLKASKETTERLRANSHLDFSPQFANCMTRSDSTVSFVEPGPHGSRSTRSGSSTKYSRRGTSNAKPFYTDDDMPASSSDEMFLL